MEAVPFEKNLQHIRRGSFPAWLGHTLTIEQFYQIAEELAPHIHTMGWGKYQRYINQLTTKLAEPIKRIEEEV